MKKSSLTSATANRKTSFAATAAINAAGTSNSCGKRNRTKKKCPVIRCGAAVISLPRHLRLCHNWSSTKALAAVSNFGLRKPYEFGVSKREPQMIDLHRRRRCPVDGCYAVVKRLPPHIRKHHGIRDEVAVRQLLRSARNKHRIQEDSGESDIAEDYIEDDQCVTTDYVTQNARRAKHRTQDQGESVIGDDDIEDQSVLTDNLMTQNTDDICATAVTGDSVSFDNFQSWLLSPDGGLKSPKSAAQHAFQVKQLLAVVDPQLRPAQLMFKHLLQQKFLDDYVKARNFLPGTTKSYLCSLVHFFNYRLLQENLAESVKVEVHKMIACIRRWIASFRKQCNERALQKMDADIGNFITSEDIAKFERSQPARNAVKLLGLASNPKAQSLTAQDYVLVRDYLMAEIVLANANRTGVLANMTVRQVKEARVVDQHFVISVAKHKTAWTQGPAKVVLTKAVYSWLHMFALNIHAQVIIQDDDTQPVFLTANGECMESSQVCRALRSIWTKAGMGKKLHAPCSGKPL